MNIHVKFSELSQKLNLKFEEIAQRIDIKFAETAQKIDVDFGDLHRVTTYIGGEIYTGDYRVTPKVEEQTLSTKEKSMVKDVTVKAIPFFNVSNTSGGRTVYIGSEV